jgi:hypothetical protein
VTTTASSRLRLSADSETSANHGGVLSRRLPVIAISSNPFSAVAGTATASYALRLISREMIPTDVPSTQFLPCRICGWPSNHLSMIRTAPRGRDDHLCRLPTLVRAFGLWGWGGAESKHSSGHLIPPQVNSRSNIGISPFRFGFPNLRSNGSPGILLRGGSFELRVVALADGRPHALPRLRQPRGVGPVCHRIK